MTRYLFATICPGCHSLVSINRALSVGQVVCSSVYSVKQIGHCFIGFSLASVPVPAAAAHFRQRDARRSRACGPRGHLRSFIFTARPVVPLITAANSVSMALSAGTAV